MLRTLILLSVFIPAMTKADQREPYFYRLKPVRHTGNPVIDTEPNKYIIRTQPPYEYTFTVNPTNEPVTVKPVITETGTETYINLPAYILNSLELNDSTVKENAVNIKDLFSNVRLNEIKIIQLPIVGENLLHQPIKQDIFSNNPPNQSYKMPTEKVRKNQYLFNRLPLQKIAEKLVTKPVTELTVDKDHAQFFNPQLAVLTEKPVYEQSVLPNAGVLQEYMSRLPVLAKKLVMKHKEKLLKEKLVSLFLSSKKDVENQIRSTQSIHDTFKSGTMYRIGYLTSFINKMNDRLKKLYETVQDNQHYWDSLRILEAYEEMKRDSEMIQDLLKMMQSFLRIQGKSGSEGLDGGGSRNKPAGSQGISWSYYDDSMP